MSIPRANVMPCGPRAAALYPPPSGRYFGCHHGHGLTYRLARGHDKRLGTPSGAIRSFLTPCPVALLRPRDR